jgi:hypothetical protein
MSRESEHRGRGEPLRWMLAGMAIALAFVGVAVAAYLLGAGVIGPRRVTPSAVPSTVPPTPTLSPLSDATPASELGTDNLYIEYILDASGSMNETLPDGAIKLTLAKDLLTEHLRAFLPETHIGLRAYGHRIDYKQKAESCNDIELIAPVETGYLPTIVTWLRDFQARGMTPLAESIRQAMDDFVFEPARINSIVMLSDGIETCDGDPCGLVQDLKAEGINFAIHVIGLDVDQPTRDQLSCIAYTSGGTYHDARSEKQLREALEEIHALVTQGEKLALAGTDTPTPEPGSPTVKVLKPTSTLAPVPGATDTAEQPTPTKQATEIPAPATPTQPSTNTPVPPTPTPTVPPRVLPQPIHYKIEGPHVCRGITTEFGEEYRVSFDKTVTEVNTCQERKAASENEVEVVCRQEFSDPEWVSGDRSVATWDVRTGKLVGQEGEDQIPDGVRTGTTTVSLAGQEFEVGVWETSYRDEWVSDGNDWWEEATCTYYEHVNDMTVRWTCHANVYVLWEGRTIHVYTCDRDIRLTETNLDL